MWVIQKSRISHEGEVACVDASYLLLAEVRVLDYIVRVVLFLPKRRGCASQPTALDACEVWVLELSAWSKSRHEPGGKIGYIWDHVVPEEVSGALDS